MTRIANIGFVVGGDAVDIGGLSFGAAAAIAFGYRWQGNRAIRGRVSAHLQGRQLPTARA